MDQVPISQDTTTNNISFMEMTLAQLQDEAVVITQDKRKNIMSFEWESEDVLVEVKVTHKVPVKAEDLLEQIEDTTEKAVVQRLVKGDKQVDIAKDMDISQTSVSMVKKKHAKTINLLKSLAMAIPMAGVVPFAAAVALNAIKDTK